MLETFETNAWKKTLEKGERNQTLSVCRCHSHIHVGSFAKSYSFLRNGSQAVEGNGLWERPDTKVYTGVSAYDKTSKQTIPGE